MIKKHFLVLVMTGIAAIANATTTYYVSPAGDNDNTGGVDDPWRTIQHAIGEVDDGDIIEVAAGIYTETLSVNKSVTIRGVRNEGGRTIIQPPDGTPPDKYIHNRNVVFIGSRRKQGDLLKGGIEVTIRDLEVDGNANQYYHTGIYSVIGNATVKNVLVYNIYSENSDVSGIHIDNGGATIINCAIRQIVSRHNDTFLPGKNGNSVILSSACGVRITNANASISGTGIHQIDNGFLVPIKGDEEYKVEIDAFGIKATYKEELVLHNNTIHDIVSDQGAYGIYAEPFKDFKKPGIETTTVHISENEIYKIASSPVDQDELYYSYGIFLMDGNGVRVEENNIHTGHTTLKDDLYGPVIGMLVDYMGDDNLIAGNELTGLLVGLQCRNNTHIRIEDNTFEGIFFGMFVNITLPGDKMDDFVTKALPADIPFDGYDTKGALAAQSLLSEHLARSVSGGYDTKVALLMQSMLSQHLPRSASGEYDTKGPIITNAKWEIYGNHMTDGGFNAIYALVPFSGNGKIDQNVEVIVEENTIEGFAYAFMSFVSNRMEAVVYRNIFNGNGYGVYNIAPDKDADDDNGSKELVWNHVNAAFNYWGDSSGPGGNGPGSGDRVSAYVHYSPWLGFVPGTPPGQMTYYVDDSGSIQDAIDKASAGDIIRITGGDYEGNVITVGKDGITLYPGDSPACVTISGNLIVTDRDVLRIDIDGTTLCDQYTQVTVEGDVDLDGIELDVQLGFVPRLGDEFDIIVSDNLIGQFAQGDEVVVEYRRIFVTFSVTYNDPNEKGDNKVTLTAIHIDKSALPIGNLALVVLIGLVVVFTVLYGLKQRPQVALR